MRTIGLKVRCPKIALFDPTTDTNTAVLAAGNDGSPMIQSEDAADDGIRRGAARGQVVGMATHCCSVARTNNAPVEG